MITIKAQKLTRDAFAEFGDFYDCMDPKGHTLGAFFHDHMKFPVEGGRCVGISAMVKEKVDETIVTKAEYHNHSCELILPIDADVLLHVAPPSKAPVPEQTQAFIVPKGTAVILNIGVWHMGPTPINADKCHFFMELAERTYMTDCIIEDYPEDKHVKIEL
ncbi:MAG: ureidoglycolate hydrolase [Lachnospiraceae bacterium]|nr:ureidoglycolate hydrolase [Lachnospiraceae bacterium]